MASVSELIEKYKRIVENNAPIVGRIESAARTFSYIAPGLSATTSEFLSATVSLAALVHDSILRNAADLQLNFKDVEKTVAMTITVIENLEVFLEMSALGENQNLRRWTVVALVQIIKALLKLILLLKYEAGIVSSPPILPLKRDKALFDRIQRRGQAEEEAGEPDVHAADYTLQSSGRTVRSIGAGRQATSVGRYQEANSRSQQLHKAATPTKLDENRILAECLHILRPIVHLISMYFLGQSSWTPWMIACSVDCTSLCLMGDWQQLNPQEKEELRRRTMLMILYLLRSPFYDRYSKEKLLFFMGILAYKVPLVRIVARPLLEYLPIWQKIYSYVWAT